MASGGGEELLVIKRAECGCCGIIEDCTVEYICWVQDRYGGLWVCGLCEEAIKDEQVRLGGVEFQVALRVHSLFRDQTTTTINGEDPTRHNITRSLVQLIKKIISSSCATSSIPT